MADRIITYREALKEALREEMLRDDRIFLLGQDIAGFGGAYKVTEGLFEEFGARRVKDTPIAEEGIVGAGIGAAMVGLRPVVEIMTINFVLVAFDQIVNNAAKINYMFGGQDCVPLVIRTPQGAGHQLGAQHSQNFDVSFAYVPGLIVATPAVPADAKGLLKTALRQNNPVVFIENLGLYNTKGPVPEGDYLVPFGKARIAREGRDLTIVSHSRTVLTAMEAANILAKDGIEAEVVDLRTLRPLDVDTIVESVRKTNRVVVVGEDWRTFGVGAEIAATIQEFAFDYLDAPVNRVNTAAVPMPYSKPLETAALPHPESVVEAARAILPRRLASSAR
ncbi:MAG TPA: alpha-ketoacid dehydrogenase subunit beta [Chloroflexota bacterium]|nr:alpha-ketoacid dehydrogenase subunit beta [Chloroflexota bacterium]